MSKVCETCGKVLAGTSLRVVEGKRRDPRDIWDQDIADAICAKIIEGESLRAICEAKDMPSIVTVQKWLRVHPSFASQYARAREDQADTYADMIIKIAFASGDDWVQDPETGTWKPNHDVVNRGTYGDRIEATVKGELTTRNINVNLDATHMTAEQRALLRAVLTPRLAPPPEDGEDA